MTFFVTPDCLYLLTSVSPIFLRRRQIISQPDLPSPTLTQLLSGTLVHSRQLIHTCGRNWMPWKSTECSQVTCDLVAKMNSPIWLSFYCLMWYFAAILMHNKRMLEHKRYKLVSRQAALVARTKPVLPSIVRDPDILHRQFSNTGMCR